MNLEDKKILKTYNDNMLYKKAKKYIGTYEGMSFGGKCGAFAIGLKKHLGEGEYIGAVNKQIWALGEYWIGHVALKVRDKMFDGDGEIKDIEDFKAWGMVDEEGNEQDLYNLTVEECYEAEVVNLSDIWGDKAEERIIENTKG